VSRAWKPFDWQTTHIRRRTSRPAPRQARHLPRPARPIPRQSRFWTRFSPVSDCSLSLPAVSHWLLAFALPCSYCCRRRTPVPLVPAQTHQLHCQLRLSPSSTHDTPARLIRQTARASWGPPDCIHPGSPRAVLWPTLTGSAATLLVGILAALQVGVLVTSVLATFAC
jgi:hypothetical protein